MPRTGAQPCAYQAHSPSQSRYKRNRHCIEACKQTRSLRYHTDRQQPAHRAVHPSRLASLAPQDDGLSNKEEPPMDETVRKISAEDINPRHNWGRALPALGTMGV